MASRNERSDGTPGTGKHTTETNGKHRKVAGQSESPPHNGQPVEDRAVEYHKEAFAPPSPTSPYWKLMIGETLLKRYKYKAPLNHSYRVPPRYVTLDAEAVFVRAEGREPTEPERIIEQLDQAIERFREFTIDAAVRFDVLVRLCPEADDAEHTLDIFDDADRSILIRGLFDNLNALLKLPSGSFGGFVAGTVYRVERWVLRGNSILESVDIGWSEHLSAQPWAPQWAREDWDEDGHMEPHVPSRKIVKQMVEASAKAIGPWGHVRPLRHRLSLCAQILAGTNTTLVPTTAEASPPMPATYFKDVYRISADCLAKAFADGRLKFAVKKGGRWYYREDEVVSVWPQKS